MRTALFILLAACSTESSPSLAPEGEPGKGDGFCPGVAANIQTTIAAPFSCGAVDAESASVMTDVDRFWGSQVSLCACGPDYPDACEAATAHSGGWVYASNSFLAGLRTSGSGMPGAYVLAHEFGHEIQGVFGVPQTTQLKELQADCLAGYYLGSLVCRGVVTQADVKVTLATACIIADGTGDPIGDLDTHGTCDQRASAVANGMSGYLSGEDALFACRL